MINDKDEAENLLQEVFVKIWKNIDKYDKTKGRFYTWMVVITRRLTLDFIKSSYYNEKKKIQNDEILVHTQISNSESFYDYDLGIKKIISELDDNLRLMIELQYIKGFTQQEVADETGIPLGTVKTRTRNALLTLRKKLYNEYF
jgi:RNA polymerase sigma-70 factor (ECF subfamily)